MVLMRAARTSIWCLAAILIAAVFGLLGWQRAVLAAERAELGHWRGQAEGLARLQTENRRLSAEEPAPVELERLRSDNAAVARLRTEIESLEKASPVAVAPAAPRAGAVPVTAWKNRGTSSPTNAIETMAWSAAQGEVDRFAGLIDFEPDTRTALAAAFATLPESVRAEYRTPEWMVASLAAREVPLGSLQFTVPTEIGPESANIRVRFESPTGTARAIVFSLRSTPAGWRLMVPGPAIRKYLNTVRGGVTAAP
jgi:hypothetical protein